MRECEIFGTLTNRKTGIASHRFTENVRVTIFCFVNAHIAIVEQTSLCGYGEGEQEALDSLTEYLVSLVPHNAHVASFLQAIEG